MKRVLLLTLCVLLAPVAFAFGSTKVKVTPLANDTFRASFAAPISNAEDPFNEAIDIVARKPCGGLRTLYDSDGRVLRKGRRITVRLDAGSRPCRGLWRANLRHISVNPSSSCESGGEDCDTPPRVVGTFTFRVK